VLPDGTMAWAADGVPICQAAGSRTPEAMMPFGSGGELIAWDDSRTDINDVYVQAIDASGNRLWGTGGRAVCTATNRQIVDALLPDNAGGAYVIWYDKRTGHNELYGQHLDSSGNALWTANGLLLVPLHSLPLSIGSPLADGAGGFYLAWHDKILDTSYDVYVSRFSSSGTLVAGADPLAIDRLRLALASPNPSHGEARFSLELPAAANVTAEVVDLEGRVVRVLARSEAYSAGEHELRWDGRDQSGRSAGAGIYFAHVSAGAKSRTLKLVELR
jgi:hypothetical protein